MRVQRELARSRPTPKRSLAPATSCAASTSADIVAVGVPGAAGGRRVLCVTSPEQPGEQLLKAIAHPLRQRILSAIDEHGPISPNGVAKELGEPLGRVSHHVRVLAGLEAIELVDTQPRRGAVEHFYKARIKPWFDDDAWSKLPQSARRALFAQPLQSLLRDLTAAAAGSGLDHPRAHVSVTAFELDEAGMNELADLLAETLERAQRIQTDAKGRLASGPAERRTELGIVHFERASSDE